MGVEGKERLGPPRRPGDEIPPRDASRSEILTGVACYSALKKEMTGFNFTVWLVRTQRLPGYLFFILFVIPSLEIMRFRLPRRPREQILTRLWRATGPDT